MLGDYIKKQIAKLTEEQSAAVIEAVEAAEDKTSAEFVVSLVPHSGQYRDVDLAFASVVALVVLGVQVFNPWWIVPAASLPMDSLLAFAASWLVCARVHCVRRFLVGGERQSQQVRAEAELQFYREGVRATRARTGVLVLYSQMERRIEVVADDGVMREVDKEEWEAKLTAMQSLARTDDHGAAIATAVEQLGDFLAVILPVSEDDIDELANRPRTRE
ncbi:MAG: hypothetical protein CMO64_05030 [Verrucomicrobiales bacterium]|nr:hypothetical protein [Verrucomicrobiales bacterium]